MDWGALKKIGAAVKRGLGIQNRYDAAGMGRRMRGWVAPSTGPNKAIAGLQNIRNRARDATRNDWSGESATQKWVSNLVGVGITPRLKRIKSMERKRELVALWDAYANKVRNPFLRCRFSAPVVARSVARTVADVLQPCNGLVWPGRWRNPAAHSAPHACSIVSVLYAKATLDSSANFFKCAPIHQNPRPAW
jgi:hypothetical protein